MTTGAEQLASSVLTFLTESSVRAAAFAVVAGLMLALLRGRRAALQLWIWTVVLYAAVAMPVLDRLVPGVGVPAFALPASTLSRVGVQALGPSATPVSVDQAAAAVRAGAANVVAMPAEAVVSAQGVVPRAAAFEPATIALAIYLLGAAWLLLRAAVGWMVTRRLERGARPIEDEDGRARLSRHAAAAGLTRPPVLAESARLLVPVTTSVFHPMIVLPSNWRQWSEAKIDAVLAHEIAHVSRRDTLTQRFSLIYRAIFWPNPLSWWLHHRLATLAEQVSDEAALAAGIDRTTYAETLVGFFAERRDAGRRAIWHLAMARAGSAAAVRRVERVLAWERGRAHTITRRTVIGVVLVSAPALLLAAAARPEPARSVYSPVAALPSLANATTIDLSGVGTRAGLPPVPPGHRAAPAADSAQAPPASPAASPIHLLDADQGSLTAAQVAGHRVWILLFDESSMLAADLQKAAEGAIKWADEKMSDTDLVALASIGSKLQILQDFTNDRTKIRSGLQKFGATPLAATPTVTPVAQAELDTFNADMRLRAIKTICDSIRPIQQHKAILYFTAGMSRGADNALEARAAENACASSNTSINPVDSRGLQAIVGGSSAAQTTAPGTAAQGALTTKPGLGLSLVVGQKDCPVTIVSTTSSVADGGYASVVVRNDSPKSVRSVTVAAVIAGLDGAQFIKQAADRNGLSSVSARALVWVSRPLVTWIPTGESRTLESRLIDAQASELLSKAGAQAELGVAEVEFADGSKWTYDVKSKLGFERAPAQIPSGEGTTVKIYRAGNGVTNPAPLRRVDPQYTAEARLAKRQGDVELDVVVFADGTVGDVRVTKGLDPGLDAQAIVAAKQWLFKPAMKDGSPVAMIVGLIIEFKLPVSNAQGVVPPSPIKRVDPKYTSEAMKAKIAGDVDVEIVVQTDGTVGDVRVTGSLDPGLDQEAVAAAKQWLFRPATKDGKPVEYVATLSIEFRMHSGPPTPTSGWADAKTPDTPGLVAPTPIKRVDPKYTSDAMRAKLQGSVELDVLVQADGSVGEVRVTKSLDAVFGLDQQAIAAAKQYTFTPATMNGYVVAAITKMTVEFRLH